MLVHPLVTVETDVIWHLLLCDGPVYPGFLQQKNAVQAYLLHSIHMFRTGGL